MPVPANAQQIYSLLTGAGLSPNAAAGILGNIEQESGGNPQAGSYPGSYGLIQWTPATTWGVPDNSSVATQVGYILKYIAANGSIENMNQNASTPQAAALYFSSKYERPSASAANNPNREASAQAVAAAASSGNWPAAAGLTSAASTGGGGLLSFPSEITGFFSHLDQWGGDVWGAVTAFLSPSTWIRAGAGIAGVFLLGFGLFALAKAVA